MPEPVYNVKVRASGEPSMIGRLKCRIDEGLFSGRRRRSNRDGFTLIELLAVVMVIALLTGLIIGVASYVKKSVATSSTKAQIAAISAALESYKSDWGYYPRTTSARISASGYWEATNNWILYRALSGVCGTKKYINFLPSQLQLNTSAISNYVTGVVSPGGLTNICDYWGKPLNYFHSPATGYAVSNAATAYAGYTLGGQVNGGSFDLFSYGPDHYTYVVGSSGAGGFLGPWYPQTFWNSSTSAADDITNFGR